MIDLNYTSAKSYKISLLSNFVALKKGFLVRYDIDGMLPLRHLENFPKHEKFVLVDYHRFMLIESLYVAKTNAMFNPYSIIALWAQLLELNQSKQENYLSEINQTNQLSLIL